MDDIIIYSHSVCVRAHVFAHSTSKGVTLRLRVRGLFGMVTRNEECRVLYLTKIESRMSGYRHLPVLCATALLA